MTLARSSAKSRSSQASSSGRKQSSGASEPRVREILRRLAKHYPDAVCALHHHNAWELIVATILSAQCTDARVNMVTPALFERFPTPAALAKADQSEIESIIRSTGFFRNKAKNIQGAAKRLMTEFHGRVPETMDELLTLPGVARKTANVVLGSWFGIADGVVVDTHVARIAQRLQLTRSQTPERIEQDLMHILPPKQWIDFSHRIIHFGREICVARKPRCTDCFLEDLCNAPDKTWSSHPPARPVAVKTAKAQRVKPGKG
jgi:endonuclease-3